MKNCWILLISMALFSCNDSSNDTEKQNSIQTKSETSIESIKAESEFPIWLEEVNQKINDEVGAYGKCQIGKYDQLNDSVTISVFLYTDLACTIYTLRTFLHEKQVERLDIGENCDHDLSSPVHEWSEYTFLNSDVFKVKRFNESVHDSLISPGGYLKEGYTFDKAVTEMDSSETTYKILSNGKVIPI